MKMKDYIIFALAILVLTSIVCVRLKNMVNDKELTNLEQIEAKISNGLIKKQEIEFTKIIKEPTVDNFESGVTIQLFIIKK